MHMGRPQPQGLFVVPALPAQLVHISRQPATREHAAIRVVRFARAGSRVLITAAGLTLPYPTQPLHVDTSSCSVVAADASSSPIGGRCSCAKANLALTLAPTGSSCASLT